MTRRYYVPDLSSSGGLLELDGEEARHAIRVMRVSTGDEITLFDGRGHESIACVESVGKRSCVVRTSAAQSIDREPLCSMRFGIALPKPDRAKEMIERLTELGVSKITPLVCKRTQRAPSDALLEKLRRVVVESSKQCGRNLLLSIDSAMTFEQFVAGSTDETCWIAHPDGSEPASKIRLGSDRDSASVLVGPEGGLTDEEVELAVDSGFDKIGLGRRIYRIETAAVVLASLLGTR